MSASIVKVNLGGQERPLMFGMLAMEVIAEKTAKNPKSERYAIIYAGLVNYCEAAEIAQDFTYMDVMQWVDDALINEEIEQLFVTVYKAFAESNASKYLIQKATQQVEDEGVKKKKLAGKK